MPLLVHRTLPDGAHLGLWQLSEDEQTLREHTSPPADEVEKLEAITHEQRRREWLAVRCLLHELRGRPASVVYDDKGKPHSADGTFQLSISHSGDRVAVLVHPTASCGIDVQQLNPKIARIRSKFVGESEMAFCTADDLDCLHVIWGCKEALYKWYGKGQVDFRTNLILNAFEAKETGSVQAHLHFPELHENLELRYEKLGDYFLVYVLNT